jgi:hypothetical protein
MSREGGEGKPFFPSRPSFSSRDTIGFDFEYREAQRHWHRPEIQAKRKLL